MRHNSETSSGETNVTSMSDKAKYKLYPEAERAKRFAALAHGLPSVLCALESLPKADGTENQATEELGAFYAVWSSFRIKVMKCDRKDWLKANVYDTPAWRNYERLKHSSTSYREWKRSYSKQRYANLSEEVKEVRRQERRDQYATRYFTEDRLESLAKRVLKYKPEAESPSVYTPVMTLIEKHAKTPDEVNRVTKLVSLFIAAQRFDPNSEGAKLRLDAAFTRSGLPESKWDYWVGYAQQCWDANQTPEAVMDKMLVAAEQGSPTH